MLSCAGLDKLQQLSSGGHMAVSCGQHGERETRTLVVKNVNPNLTEGEIKELFRVSVAAWHAIKTTSCAASLSQILALLAHWSRCH